MTKDDRTLIYLLALMAFGFLSAYLGITEYSPPPVDAIHRMSDPAEVTSAQ